MLTSPTATAELTRRLGSPWVGTMVDTYHADLEGQDLAGEAAACGDRLMLVHLSDRDRALPGRGGITFGPLLQALTAAGYAGYLGYECRGTFAVDDLAESVRWIRARAATST